MPRVLITGAAGFIGMHTSIRLLREGWEVVGLDNVNDYYSTELKEKRLNEVKNFAKKTNSIFIFLREDLNSDIWKKIESQYHFDAVIHLAAQAGVRYSIENPIAYLESNIIGFQKVIEFVERNSITRFLYASSSSVYGKNSQQPFKENESCNCPESYYAATKRANELMACSYSNTHSVASVGLRFFTVYGPWGRPDMAPMIFASACKNGEEISVFNYGKQKRDFTYISDVTEAIYRIATLNEFPKSSIFCNVGYGSPTKLMDFITLIKENFGNDLRISLVPAQSGDVEETFADTTFLKEMINFEPKIDLKEGIKMFAQWYLNQ